MRWTSRWQKSCPMQNNPTVLIVGAGPTGLMMAAGLDRFGISYRIIDKNDDHTTQSRALVVQARSLEIFGQMGIAEEAIRLGERARAVMLLVRGKRALRMAIGDIGAGLTPYPYLLMLEQSKTEQILGDFLARHGHAVERNTELLDFTQDSSSVISTVRRADGMEETIRSAWLVGADGGHSRVRQTLDIPFSGKTYQQSLFVLDCEASFPFPHNEMYIVFSDRAFTGFFPLTNGRVRVLGTVPDELLGRDRITFEEVARDFAARSQLEVHLSNPQWISVYHAHHRAVATFRSGRCFLAGDAAHIHSPVGAQGMNTGLQDAYNLAWKVALVTQGEAGETLLDTYQDERRRIAQELVRTTDRAFYYVTSQHPLLKGLRMHVLPVALGLLAPLALRQKRLREVGFKTISQIALHYRDSWLSGENPMSRFPKHAPRPGDRLPYTESQGAIDPSVNIHELVDGTSLCLLVFPGPSTPEITRSFQARIAKRFPALSIKTLAFAPETRAIYELFGVRDGGYYLVRPDLYVAYRSQGVATEHFEGYLGRFLTQPP